MRPGVACPSAERSLPSWRPMTEAARRQIAIEAFGVRTVLETNSQEAFEGLGAALPPGALHVEGEDADHRLAVIKIEPDGYQVVDGRELLAEGLSLRDALGVAAKALRSRVALNAPRVVFVHAGVVGHDGSAILVPGQSFDGKSTLVAALVDRGATYLSDEFAAIDERGLVHPFPTPLSLRDEQRVATDHDVASLGAVIQREPLPVGAVIVTAYRPGACFSPERLSLANGVLALASHAIPIRQRPEQVLRALSRALEGAIVLAGERGEAASTAERLLELARR